jgi:prevent-host-death family protein
MVRGAAMAGKWTMRDAKNRFSEVVNRAVAGQAQRITRWGQDAVVVVSAKQFDAAAKGDNEKDFVKYLLSIPKGPLRLPNRTPWPKRKLVV